MSMIGTYWTGQPYSPTFIEKYDILTQEYNNADTKPVQWSIDLKARYDFEVGWSTITAFIQVDNLFDHLNQNTVFSSTGNAYDNARLPSVEEIEIERLEQAGLFTLDEIDNKPEWFSSPRKIRAGKVNDEPPPASTLRNPAAEPITKSNMDDSTIDNNFYQNFYQS